MNLLRARGAGRSPGRRRAFAQRAQPGRTQDARIAWENRHKTQQGTQDADARPRTQRSGDAAQRTQARIPSATEALPREASSWGQPGG